MGWGGNGSWGSIPGVGNGIWGSEIGFWGSGNGVRGVKFRGGGPKIMTSGGENYDPGMKIMTLRYENYDLVAAKLGWETQDPGGGNRWFGVPGMGSGGGLSRVYVRYG